MNFTENIVIQENSELDEILRRECNGTKKQKLNRSEILEVIDLSLFDVNGPTLNFTENIVIQENSELDKIMRRVCNGTKNQKLNLLKTVPANSVQWLEKSVPFFPVRGGELFQNATKSDFINEKSLRDRNVSILLGWTSFEFAFFLTSSESGGKTGKLVHIY